jgi:hypothetical protein
MGLFCLLPDLAFLDSHPEHLFIQGLTAVPDMLPRRHFQEYMHLLSAKSYSACFPAIINIIAQIWSISGDLIGIR